MQVESERKCSRRTDLLDFVAKTRGFYDFNTFLPSLTTTMMCFPPGNVKLNQAVQKNTLFVWTTPTEESDMGKQQCCTVAVPPHEQ